MAASRFVVGQKYAYRRLSGTTNVTAGFRSGASWATGGGGGVAIQLSQATDFDVQPPRTAAAPGICREELFRTSDELLGLSQSQTVWMIVALRARKSRP